MTTYSTLSDLRRILLSTRGEKIRSSSTSLTDIRVSQTTSQGSRRQNYPTISFNKAEVIVDSTFQGFITLEFLFTSPTEFSVYSVESPTDHKMYLGDGDTSTDFEDTGNLITIGALAWGGTPVADNLVTLKFQAHLSDEHVDEYIEQAEVAIDAYLKDLGYITYQTVGADLLFDNGTVPKEIQYAAAYYAAYFIFTDVYMEVLKDDSDATLTIIHRQKKRAEEFLKRFFTYSTRTGPLISNFPRVIDRIGDPVVGPGLEGQTSDPDKLARDAGTEKIFKE
jgi:hypothetical protein